MNTPRPLDGVLFIVRESGFDPVEATAGFHGVAADMIRTGADRWRRVPRPQRRGRGARRGAARCP